MSEQPTALRLAEHLESELPMGWMVKERAAAAELRRLHEENQKLQQQLGEAVWNYGEKVRANQELLEALRVAVDSDLGSLWVWPDSAKETWMKNARAAIAKGEQA